MSDAEPALPAELDGWLGLAATDSFWMRVRVGGSSSDPQKVAAAPFRLQGNLDLLNLALK